jgi:hypothetical protein
VKHELAATGRGVDLLLEGAEANPALLQLPDGLDQMGERPPQPVQPPDNQGVAKAKVGEGLRETGAFRHGTRHGVRVDVLTAGSRQSVLLEVDGLVKG